MSEDSLVVDEGILVDGLNDRLERDLGGQGISMLDHRFSIRTIPAVHCRRQKNKMQAAGDALKNKQTNKQEVM